ncbi:ATP-binding cassette domain-containing protein [Dyadobacter sandarakinus]|uniref:ATP-binding cassette domain-containing protein n=2 Tax=Dyadobacter sandarakinus TaxID=2747268 RepID=A0ABX7IF95_9BACT|nr:ATP-binding cassette domain-containing protein [Dyadobacter sandarakinus]
MEVLLHIPLGGITALTGPSGAGKTTLLRQIAGLANPEYGRIKVGGQTWVDTALHIHLPPQQRNAGFVFQDYALFPNMTILENLRYALPKGADASVTTELLEATGLDQLADRRPYQLSGGQQQRVALARALVRKPDLLLLDEPFNALDSRMRRQIQDLLLEFHTRYGFTIIIVTHDLAEIFRLANRVLVLDQGQIISSGTPAEVYAGIVKSQPGLEILGKVLECTILSETLLVKALIDHQVKTLRLPLDYAGKLVPGTQFVLLHDGIVTSLRFPES